MVAKAAMAGEMEQAETLIDQAERVSVPDEMVAAHIKAVSRLETQAASGRETAGLANESLPRVRHHLEMARELDARL